MPRIAESDEIVGVYVVDPEPHGDARGRFIETYRRSWFPTGREMVQANRSDKQAGALVGLHFHLHQADYWQVAVGTARVVLHDLRIGSPTESATAYFELSRDNARGLFIPPGVGHGFAALTDLTITYQVDQYYNQVGALGVAWNDPSLDFDWGVTEPLVSERDCNNPVLADVMDRHRPCWGPRT